MEHLNATDLRVGNYVLFEGQKIKIDGGLLSIYLNNGLSAPFYPVEISEGVLRDLGFDRDIDGDLTLQHGRKFFMLDIAINRDWVVLYKHDIRVPFTVLRIINYTHDLQNLFHSITGEDFNTH